MATVKISELPSITGATAVGTDVLPLVDVSLNTTNKITRDEFFKNIQGNVGIGTATPSRALHVKNSTAIVRLEDTDTAVSTIYGEIQSGLNGELIFNADPGNASSGATAIQFNIDGAEEARITAAGNFLIGTTVGADRTVSVSKAITGATTAYGILNNGAVQSGVTAAAFINRTLPTVANEVFTLPALYHYAAAQSTIGASATVTSQVGFLVEGNLIGATTNIGFSVNGVAAASVTTGKFVYAFNSSQNIASGGGTAYNLYLTGTAPNYVAGNVGIGTTTAISPLHVVGATVTTGVVYKAQPAQTSKAAAATLTIAELLTGIVQYTGAVATLTLPTGTLIEGGVPATFPVDMSFDVSVINTGTGIATLGTATGLTLVGSMAVAIGASGLFRFRKTAANTYTVYRIS